jgi:hypothetical protein
LRSRHMAASADGPAEPGYWKKAEASITTPRDRGRERRS